jgi:hypothetical protein
MPGGGESCGVLSCEHLTIGAIGRVQRRFRAPATILNNLAILAKF